jgi:aryl-alcohol dehydrogenase-like predicted oxidoreductase
MIGSGTQVLLEEIAVGIRRIAGSTCARPGRGARGQALLLVAEGDYCEEYWLRWQAMGIEANDMDWQELALRFAVHAPAVCCAIVGTASVEHLMQNKEYADRGPLPPERFEAIRRAFRVHDDNWLGQI